MVSFDSLGCGAFVRFASRPHGHRSVDSRFWCDVVCVVKTPMGFGASYIQQICHPWSRSVLLLSSPQRRQRASCDALAALPVGLRPHRHWGPRPSRAWSRSILSSEAQCRLTSMYVLRNRSGRGLRQGCRGREVQASPPGWSTRGTRPPSTRRHADRIASRVELAHLAASAD